MEAGDGGVDLRVKRRSVLNAGEGEREGREERKEREENKNKTGKKLHKANIQSTNYYKSVIKPSIQASRIPLYVPSNP